MKPPNKTCITFFLGSVFYQLQKGDVQVISEKFTCISLNWDVLVGRKMNSQSLNSLVNLFFHSKNKIYWPFIQLPVPKRFYMLVISRLPFVS